MSNKMPSYGANGRKRELAAYLFEFGYGLMLARGDNVSNSVGYEVLGFF